MQKKKKGTTSTGAAEVSEAVDGQVLESSGEAKSSGVEAASDGGGGGRLRALNARVEELEDDE